jgi:hypothetical protein
MKHGVSMCPRLVSSQAAAGDAGTGTNNDLSAVIHHAGVLLLRPVRCPDDEEGAPFAIHYGMQSHIKEGKNGQPEKVLYVASVLPRTHETLAMAAGRALVGATSDG